MRTGGATVQGAPGAVRAGIGASGLAIDLLRQFAGVGLDPDHAGGGADFQPVGAVAAAHPGLRDGRRERAQQHGHKGQPGGKTATQAQERHRAMLTARSGG